MNKCQTIHSLKTWFLFLVVLVAEVTQPSLGVGYEIGRAVALGKVIICLFRPDSGKSKILRTLKKLSFKLQNSMNPLGCRKILLVYN